MFRAGSATPLKTSRGAAGRNESTDYIIVGGGPAGMVVAEQLTRDSAVNVVLIEAGPDPSLDPLIYSTSS